MCRRAPGAAAGKANLSLPPADAHRRRDRSGDRRARPRGRDRRRAVRLRRRPGRTVLLRGPGEVCPGAAGTGPGGNGSERSTVTVRVPALAELDDTARCFAVTRSGFAVALVDLHLR